LVQLVLHDIHGTFITEKKSLFSVIATLKDEMVSAAMDEKLGSVLLYSFNRRILKVILYFDLVISRSHELLCEVGTKSYCFHCVSPSDIQSSNDRGLVLLNSFVRYL
jgi:hypothetical protein